MRKASCGLLRRTSASSSFFRQLWLFSSSALAALGGGVGATPPRGVPRNTMPSSHMCCCILWPASLFVAMVHVDQILHRPGFSWSPISCTLGPLLFSLGLQTVVNKLEPLFANWRRDGEPALQLWYLDGGALLIPTSQIDGIISLLQQHLESLCLTPVSDRMVSPVRIRNNGDAPSVQLTQGSICGTRRETSARNDALVMVLKPFVRSMNTKAMLSPSSSEAASVRRVWATFSVAP